MYIIHFQYIPIEVNMASGSSGSVLFDILTTRKEWLVHSVYNLFEEKDVTELFGHLSQYGFTPGYSVNITFLPKEEKHFNKYRSGSKFMKNLERKAGDTLELILDLINVCKRKNIEMTAILIVY